MSQNEDTVTISRALFEAVLGIAEELTKESYAVFKAAWGDRIRAQDVAMFDSEIVIIEMVKNEVK